jgi:hypothetical protein
MASTREGFGLVVLEALASGTPVVASRIAPFTEYLDDDSASWADPLDIAVDRAGHGRTRWTRTRSERLRARHRRRVCDRLRLGGQRHPPPGALPRTGLLPARHQPKPSASAVPDAQDAPDASAVPATLAALA